MGDSSDEIEPCQNVGPHALVESVRSKAVIKLSLVELPAYFNRLECNTNLNLPPSNWLTSSNSTHGLHQALYQNAGFASFRLGQMFPDCVGEVDVVSDAENIKKLLKLPYTSKGAVSMIVHKVGNKTLLLDEFDIQKYLLRNSDNDWKWLRRFILERVLAFEDKDSNYSLKDKSREALQTKNLLSKFLYYSLKQSSTDDESDSPSPGTSVHKPTASLTSPVLPEAKEELYVPDPKSNHAFNRNVVWTFEDIRMLVGTNFPIFGGKNRPCVSLRLRDVTKPINILTGIDYWLDNLMCNVPEVVMCYHLDGIVQKYEIIKTEDLPYLEDSQFSPQVVRNVAQNILSFLKANATKAGHTYWLFKGRNDDVVKLYDLTTLCKSQTNGDDETEKQTNPFTVPVGMLLYKVAHNMKRTVERITPKTAGNIRALLDNCIELLPKEKYPQIVTSSHYLLADLHVPAGIDPQSPRFDEVDSDESLYDDDEEHDIEESESDEPNSDESKTDQADVVVQNICDTLKDVKMHAKQTKPTPLIASTEERCKISLQHISAGISCLQYFKANEEEQIIKESEARAKDEEKLRIVHEEQNPNMAKPFNAIPLPYESLQKQDHKQLVTVAGKNSKKSKKNKAKKKKAKQLQVAATTPATVTLNIHQLSANFNNQNFGSWNVHLKLLLLEKASLTYATLAELRYDEERYGASLNAIYMSLRCQLVVSKYVSSLASQYSCLMGRAGDCFFQMSKKLCIFDLHMAEFKNEDEYGRIINAQLNKELNKTDVAEMKTPLNDVEQLMCESITFYTKALKHANIDKAVNELERRLGNVRNELGLQYMYKAQDEYQKVKTDQEFCMDALGNKVKPTYVVLAKKSYESLQIGIKIFQKAKDDVNLAFLNCNVGRYMRWRAHLAMPDERFVSKANQKMFYNESFKYYEKAKEVLGSRSINKDLWDLVHWELSTAMFNFAKITQDCSTTESTNYADVSKETLDLLQKSLKLCDLGNATSRQVLYWFRSGIIHKRIASFYYSQLRKVCNNGQPVPKPILQLCQCHYEKAANALESLKEFTDFLVVQLERISLHEFLSELSPNPTIKITQLQIVLSMCLQTQSMLEHVVKTQPKPSNDGLLSAPFWETSSSTTTSSTITQPDEFSVHLVLFECRLENALKTLTKLMLTGKDSTKLSEVYKKMYMETLNGKRSAGAQQAATASDYAPKAQYLLNLLKRLKVIGGDCLQ